jgi:uncharacterized membrane protein YfcA
MMQYIIPLLALLLVGGIFTTVSGGGLGIVSVVAGSFFLDIKTNIALMSILMTITQFSKLMHFHGHARWDIIRWYVLPGIPMSYFGGLFMFWIDPRFLEIAIAMLCLGMACWNLMPRPGKGALKPTVFNLLAFGAVNGVIGGIIGNASLIRAPALMAMGLRKEEFIGTSTVIALSMNLAKGSAYAQGLEWNRDYTILFVCAIPVIFLSVTIGKKLLGKVSARTFELLQNGILIAGAARLLLF